MTEATWEAILGKLSNLDIRWNEPLSQHTSFHVGGVARCFVQPGTEEALIELLAQAHRHGIPYLVLGGGSNVLAPDDALDAMVIHLSQCCSQIATVCRRDDGSVEVVVGAGIRTQRLLRFCLTENLSGLEFMVGIPGTVGGALVMNAGTPDGVMANVLLWIEVLDNVGRKRRLERRHLTPTYRSMGLPRDWTVLGGCLRLQTEADGTDSKRLLAERLRRRKETQPVGLFSAGCIFKNPPGFSAGFLIDRVGLKGFRIGNAAVSEKHANWIVNCGNARARDILDLIEHIEKLVLEEFGVCLEREIQIL